MPQRRHYYVADILRAIAVLFILNSHYEGVYPIELAIGGELGLAIFFTLSGFLSSSINSDTKFIPWFMKKVIRLYFPLYIWTILLLIFHQYTISSLSDVISMFIYPTRAWFSSWIIVLYAVYFIFIKYIYLKWRQKALVYCLVILFTTFVILYCKIEASATAMFTYQIPSKVLWLFCMLIGFYIHENSIFIAKTGIRVFLSGIIASIILYGLSKIILYKGFFPYLKCMPTIFSVIVAILLLEYSLNCEGQKINRVKSISENRMVQMLSSCSLEIYYVQGLFIRLLKDIKFPINWICITMSVLIAGCILHFISTKCTKFFLT